MRFKNHKSMVMIVSVLTGILIYVIPRIALGAERIDDYEMKSIGGEQIDYNCNTYCQPSEICPDNLPDSRCCKYTGGTHGVGPHNACAFGTQLTSCGSGTLKDCQETCSCRDIRIGGSCVGCGKHNCYISSQLYSDC